MQEEEIAHWQAVIQTNSGDADAFVNLGVALYRQDKRRSCRCSDRGKNQGGGER
jgi:hypothetical protein